MIERKKYIKISMFAFLLVASIGIASFFLTEPATQLITGKVLTMVTITETPPINCSVELKQGFNLASFYCETGISLINETMRNEQNITLSYYSVFSYQSNNANDRWASYNPTLPNWTVQQLSTLNRRQGYWIYMNQTGTYFKSGLDFASSDISIIPGWNLIGYPTNNSRIINDSLQSINGQYNRVESYQHINGSTGWYIYIPGTGGNITHLEPGKAYWINATSSGTININW